MDSPDLAEKYRNKPEQLLALKANAPRTFDEVRGVTLYRDTQYTYNSEEAASSETLTKRVLTTQEKGEKRVKTEKKEGGGTSAQGLTQGRRTRLEKQRSALVKETEGLAELLKEMTEDQARSEYIPKPALAKITQRLKKAEIGIQDMSMALEEGWQGKGGEAIKSAQGQKAEVAEALRTLKVYKDEADKDGEEVD